MCAVEGLLVPSHLFQWSWLMPEIIQLYLLYDVLQ
jgi:hypothetical protein